MGLQQPQGKIRCDPGEDAGKRRVAELLRFAAFWNSSF